MARRLAFPPVPELARADLKSRDSLPRTAGLLVSVRNASEADELAGLSIAVLDIKEPHNGPLAAASPEVWHAIARQNARSQHPWRLSVALGECMESLPVAERVPASMSFAKAGPANVDSLKTLETHWTTIRERMPPSVELVAVAYADHRAANCPPADSIFALAARLGMKTWLLDTFEKKGLSTLDHLSKERLCEIALQARLAGAQWVLAGSMRAEMLRPLADSGVAPDLWGVRGDVCKGSRVATIDRIKVQNWLTLIRNGSHPKGV